MGGLFSFGSGDTTPKDRRFLAFEEKSIDEQASEITKDLLWNVDNSLFTWDMTDRSKRHDVQKSIVGCGIFVGLISMIDVRVLNRMKHGKSLGPLRKFLMINALNAPFYYYFYYDIYQSYSNLQRHLVEKYLISGDEIMYKKDRTASTTTRSSK